MKNVLLSALLVTVVSSLAFADLTPMAAAKANAQPTVAATTMQAPAADKVLGGLVKSVSLADAVKGTKSEIVVTDAMGKYIAVLVTTTSTLYDADAKAITLDKIAVASKVAVLYTVTADGVNQAKSVRILK